MDILELEAVATFTAGYVNIFTAAFCLALGVILKHGLSKLPNNLIPGILSVLGVAFTAWQFKAFTPEVMFTGIASAIASCGIHSAGKNTWIAFKEFVEVVIMKWRKAKG